MKKIAIYVEGGGDTTHQKAELRNGFDELLSEQKRAARAKLLGWKLVPSGGRDKTFRAFINSQKNADDQTLCVLLVDSEEELPPEVSAGADEQNARTRRDHLVKRDTSWNLRNTPPDRIHLMVQCMETWIVADPEALQTYYGNEFRANQLPNPVSLEDEPKDQILDKLKKATKDTKKGKYEKISHASRLLARIDTKKIGRRCPRFATFATWLSEQIADA